MVGASTSAKGWGWRVLGKVVGDERFKLQEVLMLSVLWKVLLSKEAEGVS